MFFVSPQRGTLQVNRMGWAVRPPVPRTIRKQGPPPPPTAGGMTPRRCARGRRAPVGLAAPAGPEEAAGVGVAAAVAVPICRRSSTRST